VLARRPLFCKTNWLSLMLPPASKRRLATHDLQSALRRCAVQASTAQPALVTCAGCMKVMRTMPGGGGGPSGSLVGVYSSPVTTPAEKLALQPTLIERPASTLPRRLPAPSAALGSGRLPCLRVE
jgi:hypothetical protein